MKYGVCTWTFGNQDFATTAATIAELGLDGVELLGDLDLYSAQEAKRILDDNGLEVFSLTPADPDLTHPDRAVRDAAVDYYYRLIEFGAEFGQPLVSCHGLVGRIKPLVTQAEEDAWMVEAVRKIGERAQQAGLKVVFEVLNRYETHQIHNHVQAGELIKQVGLDNVGILLDAYHMNIEEDNPAEALANTASNLWVYHVADSNRAGVGHGHTDFKAQVASLKQIDYSGPVIFECTTPGPNPFTPEKDGAWREVLKDYLRDSLAWFQETI